MQPRQVPYNTGKVKIGSRYEPPKRNNFSSDELTIQDALLWTPEPSEQVAIKRYVGLALFTILLGLVVFYAKR